VIAPGARQHRHAFKMTYPYMRTFRARSKRFLVGNAFPSLMVAHMIHRFDLVHCQGEYHETMAAYYFHRMTGIPYVCRPVGGGFTNVESYPGLQKKLVKSLSEVSLMVAQGTFLRQRIEQYGIPADKIVTINNGVRVDEIRSFKSQTPLVAPPYLLFAGGLKPVKGYDIALAAFARIAHSYPDLKLVMMGIDQKRAHFNSLVSELGLTDRVHYLHWCDRSATANLFCHASIYLCPFHRSPFSNANLEALAAGVPIVATSVEGNLEQITDGVEGYLIPPNDADALAEKIDKIISNPQLRERLGKNALSRSSAFEWQRMVDRYEQSYGQVLSMKRC
jgi:glycosyltransferase involved in cell wall biosynthesis